MHLNFDVDLTAYNTFGVSARAYALAEIEHWHQLERVLDHPRTAERPMLVLGGGSNVLFRDNYPGLILKIKNRGVTLLEETSEHCFVRIAAGEVWHDIVIWSVLRGLWGIENLALIPGEVGAAPIQNIGAYGAELSDCLVSVKAFDRQLRRWVSLSASECQLAYRSSLFKDHEPERYILSEILLRLNKTPKPQLDYPGLREVLRKINGEPTPVDIAEAVTWVRQSKLPDPHVFGNAGSFFKNPIVDNAKYRTLQDQFPQLKGFALDEEMTKLSAGWLIDQCGLKGVTRGDAGVYREHALVLVNLGQASGKELWALALEVQAAVRETFGVVLEPEPLVI